MVLPSKEDEANICAYYTLSHIEAIMRTNINIDDTLMNEAMEASDAATKKAAVEKGLELLVQVKKQNGLSKLRGKLEWEGDLAEMRTDA